MSYADNRMRLLSELASYASVARDMFSAFKEAGFEREEALQLTLQMIDRAATEWFDDEMD